MSDHQGLKFSQESNYCPLESKKSVKWSVNRSLWEWKVQAVRKSSISRESVGMRSYWHIGLTEVDLFVMFFGFFSGNFSGFYCPSGSAYPQPCEAGSYCNQTGLEVPGGACAAGYYCPKGSVDPQATSCPTGHYCPLGTHLPLPCPAGTIKSKIFVFFIWV